MSSGDLSTPGSARTSPPTPATPATPAAATPAEPKVPATREEISRFLSAFLKSSGRANETENAKGAIGGARSREADARAEAGAGTVLAGIEKGTRQNQKAARYDSRVSAMTVIAAKPEIAATTQLTAANLKLAAAANFRTVEKNHDRADAALDEAEALLKAAFTAVGKTCADSFGESRPLAHPVSAHGKGTDQVSRVVSGYRADQLAEERAAGTAPADTVALTGGKPGVADTATPKHTVVGTDASNVSGAFTSNQGMLGAVSEGFAQADMISRHAEGVRGGAKPAGGEMDQRRFATNIETGEEPIGYNLEVTGKSEQAAGTPMAPDEMAERFKAIKRTDEGITKAQVVLDPAYVDGRRAGWNLQTAYANADDPTKSFAKPADVAGSALDIADKKVRAERKIVAAREALAAADAALRSQDAQIAAKTLAVNKLTGATKARVPDKTVKVMQAELAQAGREIDVIDSELGGYGFGDPLDPPTLTPTQQREVDALDAKKTELEGQQKKLTGWIKIAEQKETRAALVVELEALTAARANTVRDAGLARTAVAGAELEVAAAEAAAQQFAEDEAAERARLEEVERMRAAEAGEAPPPPKPEPVVPVAPVTAGYDPRRGEYTGDRPAKPASLKGVDEDADPLTAHHLYPWNKIKDDLNKALASRSASAMRQLFAFGEFTPPADFYAELAKEPAVRNYAFSEAVNQGAQKICWSPANVFMGPLGSKRGDDPGEELDAAHAKSGLPTPASAVAELIERAGGIGGVGVAKPGLPTPGVPHPQPGKLAEMLARNVREAQEGQARPYDPDEWVTDAEGKKVRKGALEEKAAEKRRVELPEEILPKTPPPSASSAATPPPATPPPASSAAAPPPTAGTATPSTPTAAPPTAKPPEPPRPGS